MTRPPLQQRKVRGPRDTFHSVTVSLVKPRDVANMRVVMARFQVKSYSAALRCALREAAGDTEK